MNVEESAARAVAKLIATGARLEAQPGKALEQICVAATGPSWRATPQPDAFDWRALVTASDVLERAGVMVVRDHDAKQIGGDSYGSELLGTLLGSVIEASVAERDVLMELVAAPNEPVGHPFSAPVLRSLRERLRDRLDPLADLHTLAPLGARLVIDGLRRERTVASITETLERLGHIEAGGLWFDLARQRVGRGGSALSNLKTKQWEHLRVLASTGRLTLARSDRNGPTQLGKFAELVCHAYDGVVLEREGQGLTWTLSVAGAEPTPEPSWQLGDVTVRPLACEVEAADVTVSLPVSETVLFALLAYFAGSWITHAQIREALPTLKERAVGALIDRLRRDLPIAGSQVERRAGRVRLRLAGA